MIFSSRMWIGYPKDYYLYYKKKRGIGTMTQSGCIVGYSDLYYWDKKLLNPELYSIKSFTTGSPGYRRRLYTHLSGNPPVCSINDTLKDEHLIITAYNCFNLLTNGAQTKKIYNTTQSAWSESFTMPWSFLYLVDYTRTLKNKDILSYLFKTEMMAILLAQQYLTEPIEI